MLPKSWLWVVLGAALMAGAAPGGTFGTVVPVGGEASDLVLDEARGVLYVANFTANRIDVVSLATNTVQTSINVAAQPSSVALSPDGHWLLVAQYGNSSAAASQNGLTLIDLTASNAKQTFALGDPPLGVAFGRDNQALVVTTTQFLLFDPRSGTTRALSTIQAVAKQALPVPAANFPPQITGASVGTSADYSTVYGLADDLVFIYSSVSHQIVAGNYTSSPPQGPRAVAVAADGSYAVMGWILTNQTAFDAAEFPNPTGALNIGGHAIDSARGLVYSQVPTKAGGPPVLTIRDADNLTLRESIQLPENLAGKAVLTSDGNTMYGVSDSGVLVLPVGSLNQAPRVTASTEDLLYLGNFCDRNQATQTLTISDPGGNNTPFSISSSNPGVTVSPSTGMTPAVVNVTVNPNAFSNEKGTAQVTLTISSSAAVNLPPSVRVLINSQEPDQRGTIVNIPGTLVDVQADSIRNQYYVLRQDKNRVEVFNSANNTQIATLRTCTKPTSMGETFDGGTLLVGCDNAHIMSVFDLNSFQALHPIDTYSGYVQSMAVSSKSILAVMRDGSGGSPYIARVDVATRLAPKLTTLGVYQNQVALDTMLAAAPNGSSIVAASSDGSVYIYDATADTFTVSRKDFSSLSGPVAASNYGQYVVGSHLLNSSGVQVAQLETGTGNPSGFAFVDKAGYRTTAPDSASPGVIQTVDLTSGTGILPTRMVEAPILGASTTSSTGSTGSTTGSTGSLAASAFTQSLAPLADHSAFINLTTSGISVVPWNFDALVAPPQIAAVVSAADSQSPAAPGGLISVYGTQLSAANLATTQLPVPTSLANSCVTVNGQPMPLLFVSPSQINAQMPFQAVGKVTVVAHTPGGVSDNYNITVEPNAPAVFLSGVAGPATDMPTIVRASNNLLVTDSDPVHRGDTLVIYLTGMGTVTPTVDNGFPGPSDPPATTLTPPVVKLGGTTLDVEYAGLAPGEVGVYQLNVTVPQNAPQGLNVPLTINQAGATHTVNVRVVQ